MDAHRLPVPWERVARGATYLLIGTVGFAVIGHFFHNPYAWPNSAISGMAGFFLMAGLPAAIGALTQRYRVEYMCIPFILGGLALYTWWLWAVAIPSSSILVIHTLISVTLLSMVVTRLCALHPLVKSRKEQEWIGPK